MSAPVEAQSLSSLTNLFTNPPQYPRNPTHQNHEPLVLYIVRVPGSKDVFLTPLKPPTKASISLEAIQSSLYYLHVSSDEDDEVKRSIDEERRSQDVQISTSPISRKPLPPTPYANYPAFQRPKPPPKSYPSYQPGLKNHPDASQSERYAARGSHLTFNNELRARDPNTFRRGSRPNSSHQACSSMEMDQKTLEPARRQLLDRICTQEHISPSGFPTSGEDLHTLNHTAEQHSISEAERANYLRLNPTQPTIILIRRDPVSGGQWNVGLISQLESSDFSTPLQPVMIELGTPGYSRFSHSGEIPDLEMTPASADTVRETIAQQSQASLDESGDSPIPRNFTRTVDFREFDIGNRRPRFQTRTQTSHSLTGSSSPTKAPRHVYSFISPWKGLCTFHRGIDTRSLRCNHLLPTTSLDESNAVEVAELRFNLPRSNTKGADVELIKSDALPISELVGPRSGKEAFRKSIQQFKNRLHKDQERIDPTRERQLNSLETKGIEVESDRISLTLGREKAGGGYRGTSAKLGKLIISDEGLKMCDLVVAACMGVWWQHYEAKS